MPSARKVHRQNTASNRKLANQKLLPVLPDELGSWSDSSESDSTLNEEADIFDLDESRQYTFQQGERVWVRTAEGNWFPGKINSQTTRKGLTRQKEGLFYPVVFFEGKVRKYFAPLNGEIKPDIPSVRRLLKLGGWIDDVNYLL